VTDHLTPRVVRRAARAVALTPAVVVAAAAAPALASPPEQWEDPPSVSGLDVLLVLFVAPLALFLLITLLVYLPSMVRGEKYQPGLAWRNEPEWFGGPKDGLAAADRTDPKVLEQSGKGGASAHW